MIYPQYSISTELIVTGQLFRTYVITVENLDTDFERGDNIISRFVGVIIKIIIQQEMTI